MKTFAVAWIVFQLAIYASGATFSPREVCLRKVNEARASYAETHHIANMNKLRYNKMLEKKIIDQISLEKDCSEPVVPEMNGLELFWDADNDGKLVSKLVSGPDRTMMACVKQKCKNTGKNVVSIIVDTSAYKNVDGLPGTECSRFRTPQLNGLCALRMKRKGLLNDFFELGAKGIEAVGDITEKAVDSVATLAKEMKEEAEKFGEVVIKEAAPVLVDAGVEILRLGATEVVPHLIVPLVKHGLTKVAPTLIAPVPVVGAPVACVLSSPAGEYIGEILGVMVKNQYEKQIAKVDWDGMKDDIKKG